MRTPGQYGDSAAALWAAIGFAFLGCSRREPPPPPPPPPPLQVDRQILDEAMHQCFTVDCDKAHEHAALISADSPLRESDDFHAIEFRFEVNQLLRVDGEPDVDKQRALLERLRDSRDVDSVLRMSAAERLARLGSGARFELVLAGTPDAGDEAGTNEAAEIARLMRSRQPADYQAARALIEPRLFAGKASPYDIRVMTTICKAQKDTACLKNVQTLKLR
jgi:hypothetical protein